MLNICNDDGMSCSSGTLEEDSDDGINVTIVSATKNDAEVANNTVDQNEMKGKDTKEKPTPLLVVEKNRSGSEKKRIRKLLNEGYTYKEACNMLNLSSNNGNNKRNLDRTNSGEDNHNAKRVRGQPGRSNLESTNVQRNKSSKLLSYRMVAGQVRIGIVPKEYPSVEMSPTQLEEVQEAILSKVVLQRDEEFKPKFLNCLYRPGYIVLVCENQQTATWLKTITPSIEPWEGAKIEALDEEKIPRPEVLLAFFPRSADYSDERIIELIESQNNLKASSWRILNRTIKNGLHVEWVITVDHASMVELERTEFSINYRFTKTKVYKKGMQKHTEPDGTTEETTEGTEQEKEDNGDQHLEDSRNTEAGLDGKSDLLHKTGPSGVKGTRDGPGKKNEGYVKNMDCTREVPGPSSRDRSKSSSARQKGIGNPRDRIGHPKLSSRHNTRSDQTGGTPSLQRRKAEQHSDG